MRFEKERNIVRIYLDGSNSPYTLDINTGILLGIKGQPLKNTPKPTELRAQFRTLAYNRELTNLGRVIYLVMNEHTATAYYANYLTALSVADRLDAINAPCLNWNTYSYEELDKEFREFAEWTRTEGFDWDSCQLYTFRSWKEHKNFIKKFGKAAEGLNAEMIDTLIRQYGKDNLTVELLDFYQYYLVRGKYWEYHGHNLNNLYNYRRMCEYINKKPEKVNNFMREYMETKLNYERNKEEYDKQRFTNVYDKVREMLTFDHGNLQVVIPTSPQDLIREGERQRNCVGGYVDTVLNGRTYVVFVRHKDNLDKNYITCEVRTDGYISQFYLAGNNWVRTDEDRAFRDLFAEHIKKVLAEMEKTEGGQ